MIRAVLYGFVVTVSVAMLIAVLGRSWDWSPFALVMSGAWVGWMLGTAALLYGASTWQCDCPYHVRDHE